MANEFDGGEFVPGYTSRGAQLMQAASRKHPQPPIVAVELTEAEKRGNEQLRAYYDAQSKDEAWHNELVRVFGKDAGTARYQSRGVSTPELKRLHDEWQIAQTYWRELFLGRSD